jgi:phosphoglycerate kinase
MERLLHHPERPFVAVLGGAKIETKLPLIRRFARDADHVLVGGSIANTLLAKAGRNTGLSEVRRDIAIEPDLMGDGKVILPSDIVAATALRPGARRRVRTVSKMGDDEYIADIGPATRTIFGGIIASARTIVWNGPMGFAEVSAFARGTTAVAEAIARARAFSVVGGGDTMSLLSRRGMPAGFSHVSTGGGAMLAFLAGEQLPGIEALAE